MNITKEQVIENIELVKKYISEIENKKEEQTIGIAIKNRFTGEIIFQSTKTTYKDAILEKGDAALSGANLHGADLSGADLHNANLSDAALSYANLSYANLSYANLSYANLSGANLSGAEMQNVKFYGKSILPKPLLKKQLPDFLNALGFKCEDWEIILNQHN